MGARWNDLGTSKPDWLTRDTTSSRNIIATKEGWVYRTIYTNGFGQSIVKDEVLVSIGDLSNTKTTRQPRIAEVYTANNTGGTTLNVNHRIHVGVVYDEGLKGAVAAWTLAMANTVSGNSMVSLANSSIGNANNTLRFNFVPTAKGTYKINAQTLGGTGNIAADETTENALKVISTTVSNALSTFRINGVPLVSRMILANSTGGTTYKRNLPMSVSVWYDDTISSGTPENLRLTVANTSALATAGYATGLANTIVGTKVLFTFTPTTAGTYKVSAQTIANTATKTFPKNAGLIPISRLINASVSNTYGAFTVS